jgi:hypothetical protein
MKITKRAPNISDDNDRQECRLKLSDLKMYVANLKRYLDAERDKMDVAQCQSITVEIEAWNGFFKMAEKLNMKSGNPTRVKSNQQ